MCWFLLVDCLDVLVVLAFVICKLNIVVWLVCVGSDFCDRTQLSTCPHPPVSIFVARTVNKPQSKTSGNLNGLVQ